MSVARNVNNSGDSVTNGRRVLSINIPVMEGMKTVSDFTNHPEYYYRQVGADIANFIIESCMKLGLTSFKTESLAWINELVGNSYDAYAAYHLQQGTSLNLKVVIQNNETRTVIKFKDNASGFVGYPKSEILSNDLICAAYSTKSEEYLGGAGLGLRYHIDCVKRAGGTVQIKNRKKAGASIYSIFYHDEHKSNLPSTVNIVAPEKKSLLKL
jgi:hypothetical protein